jgi:hypothetical protein
MVNGQVHGRRRCNGQFGSEILLKISREFVLSRQHQPRLLLCAHFLFSRRLIFVAALLALWFETSS